MTLPSVAQGRPKNTPGFADVVSRARSAAVEHSRAGSLVRVRLYDTAEMPAEGQGAALRAAAGVLAAAGIDVEWMTCGDADARGTCKEPLAPTELAVRLVRLPASLSARGQLQLGYALVNTREHNGKLATVYVDRVEWLAGEAGADSASLTGLAVAHEIGHLLLGTNEHAHAGLMRAVWSRAEIQRADAGDWLFSKGQASQMRASLTRRKGLRSVQRVSASCLAPGGADADTAADCAGNSTDCGGHSTDCAGGVVAAVRPVAAGPHR